MVIIEIELKKTKQATVIRHRILSSSEISPMVMKQILNVFECISDDILNITEGTYSGNSNDEYIVIEYEDCTSFTSLSGSNLCFSFTYSHENLFTEIIKVNHD